MQIVKNVALYVFKLLFIFLDEINGRLQVLVLYFLANLSEFNKKKLLFLLKCTREFFLHRWNQFFLPWSEQLLLNTRDETVGINEKIGILERAWVEIVVDFLAIFGNIVENLLVIIGEKRQGLFVLKLVLELADDIAGRDVLGELVEGLLEQIDDLVELLLRLDLPVFLSFDNTFERMIQLVLIDSHVMQINWINKWTPYN